MDPVLARRLENDDNFRKKIKDLAEDYIKVGRGATEANFHFFDEALDLYNCHAALSKQDMETLDKGNPRRYILPMSATQAATAVSFIAATLFGERKPHKVESRTPGDAKQSDLMNMLLNWNAEQQPFYLLGHAWCLDAWLHNRGIIYENWERIYDVAIEPVEMEDPEETETVAVPLLPNVKPGGALDAFNNILPTRTVTRPKRYQRFKKTRSMVGGYTRMTNVAPYDFICDPSLPLYRANEGRFAGHRMTVPWLELERRSKLDAQDSEYVSPRAVEKLKKGNGGADRIGGLSVPTASATPPQRETDMTTASGWAREHAGGAGMNQDTVANKEDGGAVELWVLRVKIAPGDFDIYEGETDKGTWEILMAGNEVLALNEDTYIHDEFPYMLGEARPDVHAQFGPSWQMIIKPLQDHADYLKTRHEDALARTVGNVFVGDPTLFDFAEFCNPESEGQVIALKRPLDPSENIRNAIMQIPVQDLTGDFWSEMGQVQAVAETTTAANNVVQGLLTKNVTATANAAAQKFGTGRLMSVARLLSVQGPQRQTRRVMMNFQEYIPGEMVVRLAGDDMEFRDQFASQPVKITRDSIQGQFDVVPLDLTLPGTDMLSVEALMKLMEAAQWLPQLFDETVAGSLDLKAIAKFTSKKAGAPVDNFIITPQKARENQEARLQSQMASAGMPAPEPGLPPAGDPNLPPGALPPPAAGGATPV
jgi:hypothetical protein